MKRFLEKNKKIFLGIFIGTLFSGIGVYAATTYLASDVTYKNTTVEAALDDLYSKNNKSLVALMTYSGANKSHSSSTKSYASVTSFDENYGTYEDKKITINKKGKYRIFVIPVWSPFNSSFSGTANLIVNGNTLKSASCSYLSMNYIDTVVEVEDDTIIEGSISINGSNITGTLAMYLFVYNEG